LLELILGYDLSGLPFAIFAHEETINGIAAAIGDAAMPEVGAKESVLTKLRRSVIHSLFS
jgi:hypothetical protein